MTNTKTEIGGSTIPSTNEYVYRDGKYPFQPSTAIDFNFQPAPKKPFKLGFMLGRFQHIHIGHESVIQRALDVCDKVIVLVGSSQEKGTVRNPFDVTTRISLIGKTFPSNLNLITSSITDLTHENDHSVEWGRFVLQRVAEVAHANGIRHNPDLMIFGNDEERGTWFDPNDIKGISQLIVNRGVIDISATKMREYLVTDNFWMWRQYANSNIHSEFERLQKILKEEV